MVQPSQARRDVPRETREDGKLGRSPGWNLVRAERSNCCIFAYVEKQPKEEMGMPVKIGNISKIGNYPVVHVASLNKPNNFVRESSVMELDLLPGESRGYWKYHAPTKWFRQAKASGKVNNDHANLLFDTGAEISILDIAFARKVGCQIDESERQEYIGIGESVYTTEGRTRIKLTLNGNLMYIFKVWVGPMVGQDAILGMDFMVPAGIRLDLADGPGEGHCTILEYRV
ncbi:unnamed protein product [Peronospora effusa]|nr:unnamed protein product [Peronospora effusa]